MIRTVILLLLMLGFARAQQSGDQTQKISLELYRAAKKGDRAALQQLKLSAEQGNAAAFYLGSMYANGEGVTRDEERAKELFRLACKRADPIGCEASSQLARSEPVP